MNAKKNIRIEDLKTGWKNPVSADYFAGLEKSILKNTVENAELKALLQQRLVINQAMQTQFATPLHYFANLENAIASKTYNLDAEPNFVKVFENKFSRENIFTVPIGYFTWLPQRATDRKHIPIPESTLSLDWVWQKQMMANYAVAACLILTFGIGLYVFTSQNVTQMNMTQMNVARSLENISQNEILAYVNVTDIDTEDIPMGRFDEIDLSHEVNLQNELQHIDYQDIENIDEL